MPEPIASTRWRAAVTQAGHQVLRSRWQNTLEALEATRAEYRRLAAAPAIDVRAVRKASQRLHELEMLRAVLAGTLNPTF
jgi:hypothetical protein